MLKLRSVLANPRMFLRFVQPHMIKKAWFFLINNSWDLRKFLQRSEELYIRQEQYTKKFPEIIYRLISQYQLPISSKHSAFALPCDEEINLWIADLKKLSENISGHHDIVKISIIIPVYNQIRFTIACLHAIFVNDGFNNIAAQGKWFEPAFPKHIFYPRAPKSSGKRRCLFYARPNNNRNLFYLGIEVIEQAIAITFLI